MVASFLSISALLHASDLSFKSFVQSMLPLRADGKIDIPTSMRHVKLDIGLSYNAPMAQQWLLREDDLVVFGFEPNPASVASILQGAAKQHPFHGDPLETRFIGTRFFLIPCALGSAAQKTVPFYVTSGDCGCSSLFKPKTLAVSQIIEVPLFPLSDFFDLFPFDTHPVIDYIKIDAQGADLAIVKSAGNYLAERVIYITIEAEDAQYEGTINNLDAINEYMKSIGFVLYRSAHTDDPTYLNSRYSDYVKEHHVVIFQQG
jgi:FkbM family methyltransferase